MLRLENIVKTYPVGDTKVEALRGVTMEFRKNEFVAILGPSGCGKTTLLNLIGGLDSYTSGDLIISGRSTTCATSPSSMTHTSLTKAPPSVPVSNGCPPEVG